jgi:hypothetical protein
MTSNAKSRPSNTSITTELQLILSSEDPGRVHDYLKEHSHFDINRDFDHGRSFLVYVSVRRYEGFRVLPVALGISGLNVNWNLSGRTAFSESVCHGRIESVKILAGDPRVDINLRDAWGQTPAWNACYAGRDQILEWMIATRPDFDLTTPSSGNGDHLGRLYTPLELARHRDWPGIVSLLEEFHKDPKATRIRLRKKLALDEPTIHGVFVLIVFLCDGFLSVREEEQQTREARFFRIASRLPMELQMSLCHRMCDSEKDVILSGDVLFEVRRLVARLQ